MTKVVSFINLKGGVAKTTTTIQIAECLASEFGKRVLVIDLDPQTNATIALISDERWEDLDSKGNTVYHLFDDKLNDTNKFNIEKALQKDVSSLKLKNLHLLASSIRFIDLQDRISDISTKTSHTLSPMEVLKSAVDPILSRYDYVLIDCPPNLSFITQNGIEISDYYFIPTIPDALSTYGINQIVKQISVLSRRRHLKIKCLGLVITKYDTRSKAQERGIKNLPKRFSDAFAEQKLQPAPIFDTKIPQANSIADAMDYVRASGQKTFKGKYGYTNANYAPVYQHIITLTQEFIKYAK